MLILGPAHILRGVKRTPSRGGAQTSGTPHAQTVSPAYQTLHGKESALHLKQSGS